jgi:hypothetical protein
MRRQRDGLALPLHDAGADFSDFHLEKVWGTFAAAGEQTSKSALSRVSKLSATGVRTPCRLEIGDTAGWKPALRLRRQWRQEFASQKLFAAGDEIGR